jgi:hypothetical protein
MTVNGKIMKTYPSSWLILAQLRLVEPKTNLLGGSIERVGSVNQVSAEFSARSFLCLQKQLDRDSPDRDGVLTSDRSRVRFLGVGSSHDPSLVVSFITVFSNMTYTLLDDILAFPDPIHQRPV